MKQNKSLHQFKIFFLSFQGIVLVLFFVFSIISRFLNFNQLSFYMSVFGLGLSILLLVWEKIKTQGIILEKIDSFSSFVQKIIEDEFIFFDLDEENKNIIIKDFVDRYEKKLFLDISYDYRNFFAEVIENSLKYTNFEKKSKELFAKYYFSRIYGIDVLNLEDEKKNPLTWNKFLASVYYYFVSSKKFKNIDLLIKSEEDISEEDKKRAIFFMNGSLEEISSVLEKLGKLKDSEERRVYLEKLNEELREYLSEKGISLEKYSEAAFSKSENAYLIFHQKLGKQIKESFLKEGIKSIPLSFTGPFVVLSDKSKTTSELKKELKLNPKKEDSHNLIILKLNHSDINISSGISKDAKKSSKRSLMQISKSLANFGKESEIAKINSLALDKPIKDFVESFNLDFFIKDKLTKELKLKLRKNTGEVIKNLNNKYNLKKLTDLYNIPEIDIEKELLKIGISSRKSKVFSIQIRESAIIWKDILYGYGKNDK